MKNFKLVFLIIAFFVSCSPKTNEIKESYWQGQKLNVDDIQEVTHTYHMLDSTGTKIGTMVFGWKYKDGFLIGRDTSQFDNGSVYETAEMKLDTSTWKLQKLDMNIQMGSSSLAIDLKKENNRIKGYHVFNRDTSKRVTSVDSTYSYDVFREEIYMLLHALNMDKQDTLRLNTFLGSSLATTQAQIFWSGKETVSVPAGTFACDILWLKADGAMPSNKIWISQSHPRKIVKFYVPGSELSIVLI